MPSAATLLTFTLAGIVLVAIPGPSVLFIVGRALAHGRRAALLSVAGNTTGASLVVVVVALGYGAVAARSIEVFTVLKLAGAAYLVYLGVQTFRHRGDLAAALDRPAGPAQRRLYWQGVVVGVTNPKVLIFFAAVLPQFVDLGAGGATGADAGARPAVRAHRGHAGQHVGPGGGRRAGVVRDLARPAAARRRHRRPHDGRARHRPGVHRPGSTETNQARRAAISHSNAGTDGARCGQPLSTPRSCQ